MAYLMPNCPNVPPFSSTDRELAQLRESLMEVAAEALGHGDALAAGITRLGKLELLRPERRFAERRLAALLDWMIDSVRMRIRQGKYSCAAILMPDMESSAARGAFVMEVRHARRRDVQRYRVLVREKRPGLPSISRARRIESADTPPALSF